MSFPLLSRSTRELRQRILFVLGAISPVAGCGDEFGPPSCGDDGQPTKKCLTREEMEGIASFACPSGLPIQPAQMPACSERTPAEIASFFDDNACLIPEAVRDGCCNPAPKPGEPHGDGSCCYYHCPARVCCGRPLLVAGESRMAGVEPRAEWVVSNIPAALQAPDALRARIAQEWLEDGRMEHASVAAFARFTLELLGFGAPAELVAEAQRAGLDEVAHTRACFSLARHYDGVARGPARLDLTGLVPASSLYDAVRCAFLEGCVGETQAALQAQNALLVARDPHARAALEYITRDEARHAVLAWRFVAWAVNRQPECAGAVEAALAHALATVPRQTLAATPLENSAARAQLHAAGRLTTEEREMIARQAFAEVIVPCARALLAAASAANSSAPAETLA